jgi:iron complex transport system permease protein
MQIVKLKLPAKRKAVRDPRHVVLALVGLCVALCVISVLLGAVGFGVPSHIIFWQIRVPRTILALLVGGGLGLSGAALQGGLRNPLADPGLLGITGCAAVGAVAVFYWGLAQRFFPALPLGGMVGAGFGCLLLIGFAGRAPSGPSLILAGVALSAISAGLDDRSLTHVALAAPPILLGGVMLLRVGRRLDALSLGEATAATLGVPVANTLRLVAAGTALAVGAGAAVAGGIGFVGLVVPHLLRPLLGERPGALLPAAVPAGAALLLMADIAGVAGATAGGADSAAGCTFSCRHRA